MKFKALAGTVGLQQEGRAGLSGSKAVGGRAPVPEWTGTQSQCDFALFFSILLLLTTY